MGLTTLIGLVLPPVIDLINRKINDTSIRFIVSLVFCAVVGLILYAVNTGSGIMTLDRLIQSVLAVFGASQVTYQSVYSESKLQTNIRGTSS